MQIELNEQGIRIGDAYHIILASSLFYFRIPRQRWGQRMKLLKSAGYNAIDVYFPWNYHELAPGKWDFAENRDVEYFLQLARENNLFVIARPGPYICSEWDGGAIPAWLYTEGIPVRQDDPRFLEKMHSWYSRILPLLEKYQITREGTVICMQVENELDFYDCQSPVTYMGKLKEMAESFGMNIPLFYCCGQDNIVKAGGLTEGLYSSFNVYAEEDFSHLEQRCFHLYEAALLRRMPFMITETNRRHDWIKRLLASGAKLLGPYNQTAGITMDYYNGITNWGSAEEPVAIMTTDYDFHSMIGSAGNYNEEIIRSRLLAGLLHSFETVMGKGVPVPGILQVKGKRINSLLPALQTVCGSFTEVSNLWNEKDILELTWKDRKIDLEMEALETRLLPMDVPLNNHLTLCLSTYEIASLIREEERTILWLYGHGKAFLSLHSDSGEDQELEWEEPENGFLVTYQKVTICFGDAEYVSEKGLSFLPPLQVSPAKQEETVKVGKEKVYTCDFIEEARTEGPVRPMEQFGQYRGTGLYRLDIPEDGDYLFSGLADIITFREGEAEETLYCNGSTRIRRTGCGELTVMAEIWGHSNFDDIRVKSLRMGSLKGVDKILQIRREEDLTSGWMGYEAEQAPGETCFFQHSPYNPMMNADGLNRAKSPLITLMNRTIHSGKEEDGLFLHFEKAACMIDVYINNRKVAAVVKDDPYVDLSAFAGQGDLELTLCTTRRYYTDEVGKVTLYGGKLLDTCTFGRLSPKKGKARKESFPLHFTDTRNKMVEFPMDLEEGEDVKLFFRGKNVKLTVYSGNHVMGRIYLSEDATPVVCGGTVDTALVLGEWTKKEPVRIWCQALKEDGEFTGVTAKRYKSGV
ncbi:MAG: beta-galactosidase [Lachnospiraceae bacterium]|nr:beta-galactosidase [Lachnospiraceae bacterium]